MMPQIPFRLSRVPSAREEPEAEQVESPPAESPLAALPDETQALLDGRPEMQQLFEAALKGELPRNRDLKPWEPQTLNERHLVMVMLRASGLKQRVIAQSMGATDATVSIVLNHPDSVMLLAKLQGIRATTKPDYMKRLEALTEHAVGTLEDVFEAIDPDDAKLAIRRAPTAFKLLEINGYAKKRVEHDHKHQHTLRVGPEEHAALRKGLQEATVLHSRPPREVLQLGEGEALPETGEAEAGEAASAPESKTPSGLSALDAAEPSSNGSQVQRSAEDRRAS
jgi:hypothetical protein